MTSKRKDEAEIDLYALVTRLSGPIDPVGSTYVDEQRLAGLAKITSLVERLVTDIDRIASDYKSRPEYSMKVAAKHCAEFLDSLGIKP